MTSEELVGLVILLKQDKSLIQTRRIRIFQRENLIDKAMFLIPTSYQGMELEPYQVTLNYLDVSGTVHMEQLRRKMEEDPEGVPTEIPDDYEDKAGNKTHMVYLFDIDSKFTRYPGDFTLKLTLDYTDFAAQTVSTNDEEDAPEPVVKHIVMNTGETKITVLPVADYYSIVPDESLAMINQKIAELDARQREIEATAEIYDSSKADSIELHIDKTSQCIRLTSHGEPIGEDIDLNTLGIELAAWTESGLVKVITDEEEPEPEPEPSDNYANDIVLVINEHTKAIYLTHNGRTIGTPIDLNDLGIALGDWTTEGLVKVITDEDTENSENTDNTEDPNNDSVITDEEDG